MADLGNFTNTSEIIKKYQFHMQKKYGQNFLIDTHVLDKIIRAADHKRRLRAGDRAGDWHDDAISCGGGGPGCGSGN